MSAAFPMHRQPVLATWLTESAKRTVDGVAAQLSPRCASDAELVEAVTERLKTSRIELGERYFDPKPWHRKMSHDTADPSLLRRGIQPGQSYTHAYTVYRVDILSGAEQIKCGANGGPVIDPTFMQVVGSELVVRAADDRHRDRLFNELEDHVQMANAVIAEWNSTGLPQLVHRTVARLRRTEDSRKQRAEELEAAGFHRRDERRPTAATATSSGLDQQVPRQDDSASSRSADASAETAPTVLISWSHRDPDSTDSQTSERMDKVNRFANALRDFAIDADIDLFHEHEGVDWTRWGPGRMLEVDFVLVASSEGWRSAWQGHGSAGATAEADVLKSWFSNDREDFNRRTRLVVLPGEETIVPEGLDRVVRHQVTAFDEHGMETLLRDLTKQPQYLPVPLGNRPVLPPRDAPGAGREGSSVGGASEHGELVVLNLPEGLLPAIQQAVDDLVAAELLAFEQNEGTAARLSGEREATVTNHSSVAFALELDTSHLLSYVVRCDYVLLGAATSYQRTVGLTFRQSDGQRLHATDILVDEPGNLPSVQKAFLAAAKQDLGDSLTATGVPAGVTLAVRPDSVGFCTARYDVGPGVVGAPVIWVPHQAVARTYRPEFRRLLPSAHK